MMFNRELQHFVDQALRRSPAVVLLGPRQVGKTTLARKIAQAHDGTVFMDLERESDRAAVAPTNIAF